MAGGDEGAEAGVGDEASVAEGPAGLRVRPATGFVVYINACLGSCPMLKRPHKIIAKPFYFLLGRLMRISGDHAVEVVDSVRQKNDFQCK